MHYLKGMNVAYYARFNKTCSNEGNYICLGLLIDCLELIIN